MPAARGEPVAFIDLTRLSTVLSPRSCSSMASRLGLPALWRSTICLLKSSVKCLGCLGSLICGPSVSCAPPGTVHISVANPPGDPRLNLAERAFSVDGRNRLWVGGITYIPTREGWLFLAVVTGAFSRKVVGWSMSECITEKVAIDAIGQAVGREGPPDDGSLVFHDDQGAQHASRSFQRCLDSHGVIRSVSRPGTPLDNAVAESFFKTLKRELAEGRSYGTRDEAKQDIFKYIELYYNRVRMHSTLGYMSPVEHE